MHREENDIEKKINRVIRLLEKYFKDELNVSSMEKLKEWNPVDIPPIYNVPEEEIKQSTDQVKEKLFLQLGIKDPDKGERRKSIKRKRYSSAAAAIIAGLVAVGAYFIFSHTGNLSSGALVAQTEKEVVIEANNSIRIVTLPDSSQIHVNVGSKISYNKNRFNRRTREIQLEGEAFFEVAHNAEKPFIVHSGNFETSVLGTSFNVLCDDNKSIVVMVESGKVKVASLQAKTNVILVKGDQAVFDENQQQFKKMKVKTGYFTDQYKKILRFNEIPAGEAFKMMEQFYNINIQCDSEFILKQKIYAVYTNETLEKVINDLQFMIGFTYRYKNDSTIIIK